MPQRIQHILAPPADAAIFLVMTVRDGGEDTVADLLADAAGLTRGVGFRAPDGLLSCVVGIGASLWGRLYDAPPPAGLHPFRALEGPVHTAVSTPGDLLFHLRARRMDLCFELAGQLHDRLRDACDIVDEVHGFRYFDERDLLGFVDGTENPEGEDAVAAVFVGEEDPAYAGGSYVIVQKYIHDLASWNALPVEEQERAVGRTKLEDTEFPDEDKPANSHLVLNTITDEDGEERQIVRDNMPFGSLATGELGTYFIGYSATPDVTEEMLDRMFLGDPPGVHDRLLDFSTAVTGGLFFVPPAEFLEEPDGFLAAARGTATDATTDTEPESAGDGSLSIGSLKGRVSS